ncbi:MAG: ImmA/IrrE family metallo-endopeptidase [Clostridia bacterium]|nr:ImmA/IrrE family metallo-endopeptidase [Clostridia bacterium]
MNKPNFRKAKIEAYKTLITQDKFSFPINPKSIKIQGQKIKVTSLQEYSQKTGITIEQLTSNGIFSDGYTISKNNINIILYNEDIETEGRKMWTIAHELGHIVLGHTTQCEKNETEANFFAAQLLAPQCVLKHLIKNGAKLTVSYICDKFKLSKEASTNCIHALSKVMDSDSKATEYDDIIINLFEPYISMDYSFNAYFDELEDRRKSF